MNADRLRVIDFGRVSPIRSQTLWHAITHGVSDGAPPTLSLMQPDAPYVSIGFHRPLEEIDLDGCRRTGLPVYRRMVGGGPVYLDDGQLFFQITVPAAAAPAVRARALRTLLDPAVAAFRAIGIDASIEDGGDVVVGDRKICGHGAGQIEQAIVVVGNLITRFDHAAAAGIVAAPDGDARAEFETLMRRYVMATPADPAAFKRAAVMTYAAAMGLEPEEGALTGVEEEALADLDRQFVEDDWLRGHRRPSPSVWKVKVKAGVSVVHAGIDEGGARLSVVGGRILRIRLFDTSVNGGSGRLERTLEGLTLAQGRSVLNEAGHHRLVQVLEDVERAA